MIVAIITSDLDLDICFVKIITLINFQKILASAYYLLNHKNFVNVKTRDTTTKKAHAHIYVESYNYISRHIENTKLVE